MEIVNVLAWILPIVSLTLFVCMFTKWWDSMYTPYGVGFWRWTSFALSMSTVIVLFIQSYLEGNSERSVFQLIYLGMAVVSFVTASYHARVEEKQGSRVS